MLQSYSRSRRRYRDKERCVTALSDSRDTFPGALPVLSLAVPLAPTAPTTLLVFPPSVDEGEEKRVVALSGSQDSFLGALPVLTLPGFPRRGILAEPLLTWRSSSVLGPSAGASRRVPHPEPGFTGFPKFKWFEKPSVQSSGTFSRSLLKRATPPGTAGSASSVLRPLRNPPCSHVYDGQPCLFVLEIRFKWNTEAI
ncbi:hypothetical protein NDU88_006439 [Pleurodeles waltl]|uniref:Uncharacterized protein n=1 Tax=Pleurodeles waltl TaxID=8319 RepID=A0AAV7MC89_PLEWA|nr:hypothetical protein NDU88_006439 [Pleurodeles waltl]